MCLASPQAQVTPTNPAPYEPDKAYGAVRSYQTDLKNPSERRGGQTIAEAASSSSNTTTNKPAAPRSGSNIRM